MRGDLAVEVRGPAAGNLGGTLRTTALWSEAIVFDEIAVALDDCFATLRAARVFPVADHARQISGVDVAKSCLLADFDGAQQVGGASIPRIGHFVVTMKCGAVPRNGGGDSGGKVWEAAQLFGGGVEAGDEQRNDLEPHAHAVNASDAVKNRADA